MQILMRQTTRRALAPRALFRAEASGYLLVVVAAILWASLGILGKFLYRYGADPLTIASLRAVIAFLTLATVLANVDRRLLRIRLRDRFVYFVWVSQRWLERWNVHSWWASGGYCGAS